MKTELPRELTVWEQRSLFNKVRERDHKRCVVCWSKINLCVHHFWDSRDKPVSPQGEENRSPYLDTQMYELVTLCSVCHGKIHSSDWKSPLMGLLRSIIREIYAATSLEVKQK